jgi:hypothetical protein
MTYRRRPIRFIDLWKLDDWTLKLYGIAADRDRPRDDLVAAARSIAVRTLPTPARSGGRHGVGLVGAHDGANAAFVFVSWWANLYELNHVLYRAPKDALGEFARVPAELVGCTWDLRVIAFERDAWTAAIESGTPDLEHYLAARFDADV